MKAPSDCSIAEIEQIIHEAIASFKTAQTSSGIANVKQQLSAYYEEHHKRLPRLPSDRADLQEAVIKIGIAYCKRFHNFCIMCEREINKTSDHHVKCQVRLYCEAEDIA